MNANDESWLPSKERKKKKKQDKDQKIKFQYDDDNNRFVTERKQDQLFSKGFM